MFEISKQELIKTSRNRHCNRDRRRRRRHRIQIQILIWSLGGRQCQLDAGAWHVHVRMWFPSGQAQVEWLWIQIDSIEFRLIQPAAL